MLCWCGKVCLMQPPTDNGDAINREAICPDHGWVYTVSTRKDL